jgi:hypothetical protein
MRMHEPTKLQVVPCQWLLSICSDTRQYKLETEIGEANCSPKQKKYSVFFNHKCQSDKILIYVSGRSRRARLGGRVGGGAPLMNSKKQKTKQKQIGYMNMYFGV